MSACFDTVNIIMKSRMRESRTYGSVRGLHCEVLVYSTIKEDMDETVFMFALFKCRKFDKRRN